MSENDLDSVIPAAPTKTWAWLEVVGTVYAYYLLLVVCIAVPPLVVPAAGFRLSVREGTAVTLGCTLVAELAALGILAIWLRRKGLSFSDLGWRRPTTAVAVFAALAVATAYSAFTLLLPEVREVAFEATWFRLWGAAVGMFAGAVEEFAFRGFVMTELRRSGVGSVAQVLASGVAFSVIHAGFGLWGLGMTFLLGIALGIVYLLGRRSLTAPIVCHALINAVIEPGLLLFTIESYARAFNPPA